MADIHDQAQAIWKALDQMSEKDPDGYKKFIDEQMESSKKFFTAQAKNGKLPFSKGQTPMGMGIEMKEKNFNPNLSVKYKYGSVSAKHLSSKDSLNATPAPKPPTDLRDDTFSMASMLASIVPPDLKEGPEDDDEIILDKLKLPGEASGKDLLGKGKSDGCGNKKRLIEEL